MQLIALRIVLAVTFVGSGCAQLKRQASEEKDAASFLEDQTGPANSKTDLAFESGSNITTVAVDEVTVENLRVLGLVWGFIKYYHPSVARGDYNWDYELLRILPEVLGARDPAERDKILIRWIRTLGDVAKETLEYRSYHGEKMQPDVAWITSGLSQDLSALLVKIKNAKRTGTHHYVRLAIGVGNPIFTNENSYRTLGFPDAGFRLLALFRYWNIIQYYFPYKYLIQADWKEVLAEFIPGFIKANSEEAYISVMLELTARIHDTHANIQELPSLRKYFGERHPALEITFVENQAVVQGFHDESLGKATGLQRGDIITAVNGKKVDEIIAASRLTTPASNPPAQLWAIARKLLRTNDESIEVSYTRSKLSKTSILKTYSAREMKPVTATKNEHFRIISPNIAYLNLPSLRTDHLPSIFKRAKNTQGLIIDVRGYPSDFVAFSLGEYLLPQATDFVKFSVGSIEAPGLFTFSAPLAVGKVNKDYYKGKIAVLVNESTISQAEYTTMALKASPNVTVIGSTTAGADGDVSIVHLPGGLLTAISGLGVYYPDGGETQRIGIVPDIEVKPTIEGIKRGKDEVLQKAIDLIRQRPRP